MSLDPVLSDVPDDDSLARDLSTLADVDEDAARDIIEIFEGSDRTFDTDSFKRTLAHRLRQARIRRTSD